MTRKQEYSRKMWEQKAPGYNNQQAPLSPEECLVFTQGCFWHFSVLRVFFPTFQNWDDIGLGGSVSWSQNAVLQVAKTSLDDFYSG